MIFSPPLSASTAPVCWRRPRTSIWQHPATQENLAALRNAVCDREPGEGIACGMTGQDAAAQEEILKAVREMWKDGRLAEDGVDGGPITKIRSLRFSNVFGEDGLLVRGGGRRGAKVVWISGRQPGDSRGVAD